MANIKLTPEVEDVLRRSKIQGNVLVLPPGKLPRPLYEAVNKAIANCGGGWKRGVGHVFDSNPSVKLGLTLESGESVDEKKKFQAFYTPSSLARRVVQMASVDGKLVLEPSAGLGALVEACVRSGARSVKCFEINPEAVTQLQADGFQDVVCADFLQCEPSKKFERIVMNPPFTKRQDLKHVGHAYKFLENGGRLVAIMQANRTLEEIRCVVGADCDIVQHPVDAGEFKESGTDIATQIAIIDQSRPRPRS